MLPARRALVLLAVGLLAAGVVMVSSAGLTVGSGRTTGLAQVLLARPAMFAILAVGCMLLGAQVKVSALYTRRGIASPVPWITLGSFVLLLAVYMPGLGHQVNGARRWISLGAVGFQPSEVVKWGLLVVLAWHGARRAGSMGHLGSGFLAPMALVAVLCGLVAAEDLGTAVLIGAVSVCLLVAAGARLWHAALLLPVGGAGFALAVAAAPYRMERLRTFLDPYQDPQGAGYHVLQSMAAISGGGLAGRGLGGGIQKFGYLPEDTTDFLFAVIGEELGLAGALVVVALFVGLLLVGLRILSRAESPFERLLGLGILLTIGLQALMNLFVVTGMAPTKGIALPLLSSGGTGWCLTAFGLGLLVAMDRPRAGGGACVRGCSALRAPPPLPLPDAR